MNYPEDKIAYCPYCGRETRQVYDKTTGQWYCDDCGKITKLGYR